MTRLRSVIVAILLAFCALLVPQASRAQEFPPLTGRVVDAANVIPDAEETRLTQKLAALEQQSRRQLVVDYVANSEGRTFAITQKLVNGRRPSSAASAC